VNKPLTPRRDEGYLGTGAFPTLELPSIHSKSMNENNRTRGGIGPGSLFPVAAFAVFAIVASYLLAGSAVSPGTKVRGLSLIIAVFLVSCIGLHFFRHRKKTDPSSVETENPHDVLEVLDLAGGSFAGAVKLEDMLRLVASRIRSVVPAAIVALYLPDKTRQRLELIAMDGADAMFAGDTINADLSFLRRSVQISDGGVVTIPLTRDGEPFGVLELHCTSGESFDENHLFDSIGTRVSPLILNSLAFERTVTNALTDATTELPNERALYLILENQIAESQRKREERPMTLLAIDIRGFDDINAKFGHAAGDRALTFAAQAMRDTLRQMDFLARCTDDQFLAVLPTASKEISHEVISRITAALFGRRRLI
jgi:GGDEF domain-containing protein